MTVISAPKAALSGHGASKAGGAFGDAARKKLLILFFIVLLLPIQPELGGQRLDPYRLALLVLFFPFLSALVRRRAGWFTASDGLMICYAGWIVVTLVFHHGMGRFAYASILASMMLGGYMAGRLLIRSAEDYRRFIRYFLTALLILLPFTLYELFTEEMIISDLLGKVFPSTAKYYETRHGLSRVQVVFPHSILFGLFCSMALGNVLYIYRHQFVGRLTRIGLVLGMTVMALSSAPLLSIALQFIMAAWDKITRGKWMVLITGFATVYIVLSMVSNRGPVIILIEKLTFNPSTAWWRVYIWEYGVQNVMANPIFGLGLNDWARPVWLASTVDNFWLLTAMQAGIPALGFMAAAMVVHVIRIVRVKGLDAGARDIRTGYLVVFAGTVFTLSTVHIWDAMAVFVMFYIGAGSFLYTSPPDGEAPPVEDATPRAGLHYQRTSAAGQKADPRAAIAYARARPDQPTPASAPAPASAPEPASRAATTTSRPAAGASYARGGATPPVPRRRQPDPKG